MSDKKCQAGECQSEETDRGCTSCAQDQLVSFLQRVIVNEDRDCCRQHSGEEQINSPEHIPPVFPQQHPEVRDHCFILNSAAIRRCTKESSDSLLSTSMVVLRTLRSELKRVARPSAVSPALLMLPFPPLVCSTKAPRSDAMISRPGPPEPAVASTAILLALVSSMRTRIACGLSSQLGFGCRTVARKRVTRSVRLSHAKKSSGSMTGSTSKMYGLADSWRIACKAPLKDCRLISGGRSSKSRYRSSKSSA